MSIKDVVYEAIKSEYSKSVPDMHNNITYQKLGVSQEELAVAIDQLLKEGKINGPKVAFVGGKPKIPFIADITVL